MQATYGGFYYIHTTTEVHNRQLGSYIGLYSNVLCMVIIHTHMHIHTCTYTHTHTTHTHTHTTHTHTKHIHYI